MEFILGYRYFLISCIDINECLEQDDACAKNEVCVNLEGSFQCQNAEEYKVIFDQYFIQAERRMRKVRGLCQNCKPYKAGGCF
jgi:Calcium-binding EGF domain